MGWNLTSVLSAIASHGHGQLTRNWLKWIIAQGLAAGKRVLK